MLEKDDLLRCFRKSIGCGQLVVGLTCSSGYSFAKTEAPVGQGALLPLTCAVDNVASWFRCCQRWGHSHVWPPAWLWPCGMLHAFLIKSLRCAGRQVEVRKIPERPT
eukprot:6192775-Amphidinium_carterae.2